MDDVAIRVKGVYKSFKLPHEKHSGIKQYLVNLVQQKKGYETQRVLSDVSFDIKKGEFVGIVGRNGSGKSTLLKILSEIYVPDKGEVTINGSLTPFIELGVGFNPELTGRENVYLNGAMLGFSRKEVDTMYDSIVSFAELERFMDQKLKNYSSGMQVRLAFSISIRAETEILILDEVLAVGDAAFQKKCFDYFMSLKRKKRTVVLVTHDMGAVRQYCDRAIMINDGEILTQGSPEEVAQAYQQFFSRIMHEDEQNQEDKDPKRWGSGHMKADKPKVVLDNDFLTISSAYKAKRDIPAPILGFTIYGPAGNNVLENNTDREKVTTKSMKRGDAAEIVWKIPNIFVNGTYSISVAACDESKIDFYDWFNEAASFTVNKDATGGIVNPPIVVEKYNLKRG
ncbi:MAG: ABC transporter ATP-binding protein [Patescibacteria group bacterium]